MEWYDGGVTGAIASCREKNALFVVYVYDDSLDSRTTDEAWQSPEVCDLLGANSYIALKVIKDSLEYRQFSQLFAVFMFPTVFCIGRTGKSLVIMNGAQSPSQLKNKLIEAFEKYQFETSGSSQSSAAMSTPQSTPNGPLTTPTTPVSTSGPFPVDEDGASGTTRAARALQGTEPQQEIKEEKLRHYQEKIKERRAEKDEEHFKRDKQREIERREQGRNVAKFKEQQEEQRTKNWLQERKKLKEEARLAREEVRAKLEQDRLERQAQKKVASSELRQRSQPGSSGVASVFSSVTTSSTCRIQLRLPSGGTSVIQLNKTDSLEVLRDTVAKELDARVSDLILTSVYPRKELNADLDSQTMVELQLVPSGVVMVKIKKGMVASLNSSGGTGGGILGALMSLLQLVISFLTFIKNAIVGVFSGGGQSGSARDGGNQQGSSHSQPPDTQRDRRDLGGTSRPGLGDGGDIRVRKFRQEDYQDDSDEERSTYNGNSTQQQ